MSFAWGLAYTAGVSQSLAEVLNAHFFSLNPVAKCAIFGDI
jgi:hypothetical protein